MQTLLACFCTLPPIQPTVVNPATFAANRTQRNTGLARYQGTLGVLK